MKRILITCAATALLSGMAMAQTPQQNVPVSPAPAAPAAAPATATNPNNAQPIEITASKTVEWLRDQKQYVARENVVVTQGKMSILTDLLTADYRETPQSSTEIWQLTAVGSVQIKDETNTAYGDKGVYDVPSGVATLTGQNLRLVSPDQTVTATERMEYHSNEREAKAIGNAKVVRGQDILTADTITAFFKDGNAQPNTGNLDRLEADGKVVITTPTEKLYGNKGTYKAATNTAELIGKVRIERGENVLEGERAEVNLTTNVSKMFSSNKPGARVRGVFFPGSDKSLNKKGQDKSPVPAPFKASPASPAPAAPLAAPVVAPTPAMPANSAVAPAPVAVSPVAPTLTPPAAVPPDLFPAAPEAGKVSPQVTH